MLFRLTLVPAWASLIFVNVIHQKVFVCGSWFSPHTHKHNKYTDNVILQEYKGIRKVHFNLCDSSCGLALNIEKAWFGALFWNRNEKKQIIVTLFSQIVKSGMVCTHITYKENKEHSFLFNTKVQENAKIKQR